MELMRRVYRIFRRMIQDDLSLDEEMKRQIMSQLKEAIYEAQVEIYKEVTEVEP